ncbi:mastermind-like protein 2 [Scylla paramamosain]|uniref:mastermind-like protein 2 n=1 Tax=Scylla paramamosain TaxID=85552 RepID=UPI003082DF33
MTSPPTNQQRPNVMTSLALLLPLVCLLLIPAAAQDEQRQAEHDGQAQAGQDGQVVHTPSQDGQGHVAQDGQQQQQAVHTTSQDEQQQQEHQVPVASQDGQGQAGGQDGQQQQQKQDIPPSLRDWVLRSHPRAPHTGDHGVSGGERDFLTFISHDFDDDYHLDGTELFQAFGEAGEGVWRAVREVESLVDLLLHHYDRDTDGKLSYLEFSKSSLPPSRAFV